MIPFLRAMTVNVQIESKGDENAMSMLRRFRNRFRSSGVVRRVRSIRYHARSQSDFTSKKGRLRSIERTKKREQLYKLGKISEQ